MARMKIVVSLQHELLNRVDALVKAGKFPNRSETISNALHEKLKRGDKTRLARECAKLDPKSEQALAEEGFRRDIAWPEY